MIFDGRGAIFVLVDLWVCMMITMAARASGRAITLVAATWQRNPREAIYALLLQAGTAGHE